MYLPNTKMGTVETIMTTLFELLVLPDGILSL